MEPSKPSKEEGEEEEQFFDAPDEFPFYDCVARCESETLTAPPRDISTLRRRRFISRQPIFGREFAHSGSRASSIGSDKAPADELRREAGEKGNGLCHELKEKNNDVDTKESGRVRVDTFRVGSSESGDKEESTMTTVGEGRGGESVDSVADLSESPSADWSLLEFLTGLVIKAMGFQFSLLISLFSFPLWALYCCCLIVFDPFGALKRFVRYSTSKVSYSWNSVFGSLSPFVQDWLKEHKSMLQIGFRLGCGLLWAAYVGCVLCALFISSLVCSGLMMKSYVEEPIVIKENLSFDYTKNSPTAYVPIISCAGVSCEANCNENIEAVKIKGLRVIPPKHKLQVIVSLMLPESVYNRNLGMFQVRVDLLSSEGRTLASSRHPCMLKFQSEPVRLMYTIFKITSLIAGYSSESQTLNLKFRGFIEKDVPTACVRITIEQRAEFRPGAGIPELYDASLVLESELPFFKRVVWYWKNTLFVWISMTLFITELLLALLCCRPMIIPRMALRDSARRSERHSSDPRSLVPRS